MFCTDVYWFVTEVPDIGDKLKQFGFILLSIFLTFVAALHSCHKSGNFPEKTD